MTGRSHERRLGYQPEDTRSHWAGKACGAGHATALPLTSAYFSQADAFRYRVEPVDDFADFRRWSGKRVLEVGIGMGGDLRRFLGAGAVAAGIDLSPTAVEATAERLRLANLPRRAARADALRLPVGDETVDLVWSWGVLHHTGDIASAIGETHRVLRPGGALRIMLYHRPSWVALAAWGRWSLLTGHPFRGMKRTVADHIESPGTLALTKREIRDLLVDFEDVRVRVVGTHWDRKFVPVLGRLLGSRLGWFALISARRPMR